MSNIFSGMYCPECKKELKSISSPFPDGGDFYACECGVEGYGYWEPDRTYNVSFTIPARDEA
jgi:hypothetical protein